MQTTVIFAVWVLLSLLIQTVILPAVPSAYVWTDLLFYLVIVTALRFKFIPGIIITCFLGYIFDTASAAPHGTELVSYLVVFFFVKKIKENIFLNSKAALFCWIMIFSLLKQLVQIFWIGVASPRFEVGIVFVGRLVLQSFWDGLLGLFAVTLIARLLDTDWGLVFRKKGIRI